MLEHQRVSKFGAVVAILLSASALACSSKITTTAGVGGGSVEDSACDGHVYEAVGAPFMSNHCTGCHHEDLSGEVQRRNAPEDINLNRHELVLGFVDRIQTRVLDEGTMPPAGKIAEHDLVQLETWLDCGAP
ncbi:MAG: hypothetical protein VB934_13460 [Polyangiaceae bacterium]